MPPPGDAKQRLVGSSLPAGDSIKVPLTCPDCGQTGLVDWKNLKNGIGCPQCGCQFLIDRSGKVLRQADLPHVRYACPRCRKSGALPQILAGRGAACPGCKLPLVLGPDNRLHSVQEDEELRRNAAALAIRSQAKDQFLDRFRTGEKKLKWSAVLLGVVFLSVALVTVGAAIRSYFDRSPETLVESFVLACLSGDLDAPLAFIEEDAVQAVSFDRWRVRYFPSILDSHRPKGDAISVECRMLEQDHDSMILLVTMKSPFIGSRSHVQQWMLRDGDWKFDARGTLSRETISASKSKGAVNKRVPGLRRR